jgi:hypothetical protein
MFSKVLSSFCFCSQKNTENSTIKVDLNEKKINSSKNMTTKTPSEINENYINITNYNSPIKPLVTNNTHIGMNNKLDVPVKTPFYKNQSCKVNLIKIKGDEENRMNQSLIQKIKLQQKFKDENEYFNNFQQKLDYIINESMDVKSISESEDVEISLNK